MPTEIKKYSLKGTVTNPFVGHLRNVNVQVWIKGAGYNEYAAQGLSDNHGKFSTYFEIETDAPETFEDPKVLFKINYNGINHRYSLNNIDAGQDLVEELQLVDGPNNFTLYVDSAESNEIVLQGEKFFQLLNESTQVPYANYSVTAKVFFDDLLIYDYGTFLTNGRGFFGVQFAVTKKFDYYLTNYAEEVNLKFRITLSDGTLVQLLTIPYAEVWDHPRSKAFKVFLSYEETLPAETSIPISALAAQVGITISSALNTYFGSNSISTLRSIRAAGGLATIPALQESPFNSPENQETIALLDSHARLETVSPNYPLNNYLIGQGYSSIRSIAERNFYDFVTDAIGHEPTREFEAALLQRNAVAQSLTYSNASVAYRLGAHDFDETEPMTNWGNEHQDQCNCADCEAAVSPFAYLADLLKYAVTNLKQKYVDGDGQPLVPAQPSNTGVDLPFLESMLHQPFSGLVKDCGQLHDQICQYRIAIEVLNSYLESVEPNLCQTRDFGIEEDRFLETAYFTFLELIGTSYSELRDVRVGSTEEVEGKKEKLAERLGIPLLAGDPEIDTIDRLVLDPQAAPGGDREITHEELEALFGLRDYTRAPLDDAQPEALILQWRKLYLSQLWLDDDGNKDDYSKGQKPIVEPDLIGPEDFRISADPNFALDLWKHRREWVDQDIFKNILINQEPEIIFSASDVAEPANFYMYIATTGITITDSVRIKLVNNDDADDLKFYFASSEEDPIGSLTHVVVTSGTTKTVAPTELGFHPIHRPLLHVTTAGTEAEWEVEITLPKFTPKGVELLNRFSIVNPGSDNFKPYLPPFSKIKVVTASGEEYAFTVASVENGLSSTSRITVMESIPDIIDPVTDEIHFIPRIGIEPISDDHDIVLLNSAAVLTAFEDGDNIEIFESKNSINNGIKTISGNPTGNTIVVDESLISDTDPTTRAYIVFKKITLGISSITRRIKFAVEGGVSLAGEINSAGTVDVKESLANDGTYTVVGAHYYGSGVVEVNVTGPVRSTDESGFMAFTKKIVSGVTYSGNVITVTRNLKNELFLGQSFNIIASAVTHPLSVKNIIYGTSTLVEVDSLSGVSGSITEFSFEKKVPIHRQTAIARNLLYKMNGNISYTPLYDDSPPPDPIDKIPFDTNWGSPYFLLHANDYRVLLKVRDDLKAGINADWIREKIREKFHLEPDAFMRLVDIYEKYLKREDSYLNDVVTAEEWQDFYNILLRAAKVTFFADWITEEAVAPAIKMDYNYFWIAETEPRQGDFPPSFAENIPLVEPELAGIESMPLATTGLSGISLWNARREELDNVRNYLIAKHLNDGFDHALFTAVNTIEEPDTNSIELFEISSGLKSTNPADIEAAKARLSSEYLLTESEFETLVEVKRKEDTLAEQPTEAELNEAYGILTKVFKKKRLYPAWIAEEQASAWQLRNGGNTWWDEYYQAARTKLSKWRTSTAERLIWTNALVSRNRQPIVEPDIVKATDLKHLSNTAGAKWEARRLSVAAQYNTFKTTGGSYIDKMVDIIVAALDIDGIDVFNLLNDQLEAGIDIRPRLKQLLLTQAAYNRLSALHAVAQTSDPLPAEWEEVYNIAVQVWKERTQYAAWNEEESNSISLSPDFFRVPPDSTEILPIQIYDALIEWRATHKSRKQWEKKLEARIRQQSAIIETTESMVDRVEEMTLPILRDALVQLVGSDGSAIEENAQVLNDTLLVDFKVNCCQNTTRLSQAIDTIQKLIWQEWVGTDKVLPTDDPEVFNDLQLVAPSFEEEWKWLGSYATWRSAMFVFIYPENLLLPQLKREQSYGFLNLVRETRSKTRFTPDMACQAAKAYSEYYEDICTLDLQVTCTTLTTIKQGGCNESSLNEQRQSFHAFALGGKTGRVYWQMWYEVGVSFWMPIEPFGDTTVKLIGAVPYEKSGSQRHIYLIGIQQDSQIQKLVYLRFDLQSCEWETALGGLDLEENFEFSNLLVIQTKLESRPPRFVVKAGQHLYYNSLDTEGKGWQGGWIENKEWYKTQYNWNNFNIIRQLESAISVDYDHHFILVATVRFYDDDYLGYMSFTAPSFNTAKFFGFPAGDVYFPQLRWKKFVGLINRDGGKWVNLVCTDMNEQQPTRLLHFGIKPNSGQIGEVSKELNSSDVRNSEIEKFVPNFGGRDIDYENYNYGFAKIRAGSKWDCKKTAFNAGTEHCTINGQVYTFKTISYRHHTIYSLHPILSAPYDISENLTSAQLQTRKGLIKSFAPSTENRRLYLNFELLKEAYYFVPMYIGIQLSQKGHYKEALDWFKTVYDFTYEMASERRIYVGLDIDNEDNTPVFSRQDDWLLDPINPHNIAFTRRNAYHRYTVQTIANTLLSFADAQYTIDTVESVSRARELYELAIELLGLDVFNEVAPQCDPGLIGTANGVKCELETSDNDSHGGSVQAIFRYVTDNVDSEGWSETGEEVASILLTDNGSPGFSIHQNLIDAYAYVDGVVAAQPPPNSMLEVIEGSANRGEQLQQAFMSSSAIESRAAAAGNYAAEQLSYTIREITGRTDSELREMDIEWLRKPGLQYELEPTQYLDGDESNAKRRSYNPMLPSPQALVYHEHSSNPERAMRQFSSVPFVPILDYDFCIPPNPVYKWTALSAHLNLFKIRNCMNIAGIRRQLDSYAAPTDTVSGLPFIGANGQLILPGSFNVQPSEYRYDVIIDRAKQLVQIAQQIETAFLSALEKRDAEFYNVLKAKQDLALSRANVKLQDLKIKVSEGEVDLAVLQKERSQLQVEGLDELIQAGLNEYEQSMIESYWTIAKLETAYHALSLTTANIVMASDTIIGIAATNVAAKTAAQIALFAVHAGMGSLRSSVEILNAGMSVASIRAAQQRREDEWDLQKTLAQQDIKIGSQQVKIAQDRLRVTGQEKVIAELQQEHAEATVDFLSNKFTNADLYEWMSGVLERVYAYFLEQATATAKLALAQIAFERQTVPPPFIQDNYWETPTDSYTIPTVGSNAVDRRGLTGSARLLQDIYQVDQYAFDSDKRKLQLSKTFSLASYAPMEFQQFRETGVITFETLMEHFDRDFPGYYLRIMKKVKTTVIALIPPTEGIKATLTSSGISRCVVKGDTFQDIIIRRYPEMVALTGTREATGLFEMQPENNKFLNPFEGSGVHTRWEFDMPKESNLFDYDTIADVLITIEYTALHDYTYEQQVKRNLGTAFSAERAISFRQELADQFYELTHPEESATPFQVEFDIRKFDFPANLSYLTVDVLKFYFIRNTGSEDFDPRKKPFEGVDTYLTFQLIKNKGTANEQNSIGGVGEVDDTGILRFTPQPTEPFGTWRITLSDKNDEGMGTLAAIRELLVTGEITDIIMIMSYSAELPAGRPL